MIVEIPDALARFVESALVRLRAQHTGIEFEICPQGIRITPSEQATSGRLYSSVLHAVYREKIYTETLPMRVALMQAILR